MASARALAWIEWLAWILIYGGLFALVLGVATLGRHAAAGWSLIVPGLLAACGGVILIWLRSRLREGTDIAAVTHEPRARAAQSQADRKKDKP